MLIQDDLLRAAYQRVLYLSQEMSVTIAPRSSFWFRVSLTEKSPGRAEALGREWELRTEADPDVWIQCLQQRHLTSSTIAFDKGCPTEREVRPRVVRQVPRHL